MPNSACTGLRAFWRPMRPPIVKWRSGLLLVLVLALAGIYAGAAAYVLHFELDRLLFPRVALASTPAGQVVHHVSARSGNGVLIRRYGAPTLGCVVFFPGQHGGIASYEKDLFPGFVAGGMAVFALAYPGQDGAPGRAGLEELQSLVQQALRVVGQTCAPGRTVFVGRSLGAMLAAYAAGAAHPAGLVLEAAAPSLSSAILVHLRSRWYLAPLALLPVSRLLPHDYGLTQGLGASPAFAVVVFQGTADVQTPLQALRAAGALPAGVRLVAVEGGTHSNSYLLAKAAYVHAVLDMLGSAPVNPRDDRGAGVHRSDAVPPRFVFAGPHPL